MFVVTACSMDQYAEEKRTEKNLIVRSGISEAETANNKRLRSTFCIEAEQTRSIARPLCDSRASCFLWCKNDRRLLGNSLHSCCCRLILLTADIRLSADLSANSSTNFVGLWTGFNAYLVWTITARSTHFKACRRRNVCHSPVTCQNGENYR